jgi:hypothetical protein
VPPSTSRSLLRTKLPESGCHAGVACPHRRERWDRWGAAGGLGWLVSGVLLGAVVPFTLVAILPTNRRLLDASLNRASPEVEALLARWGRLHAVRSALSLVAFASFLILLAKS